MDTTAPEKTVGTNLTVISEYTESAVALADMEQRLAGLVFDVTTSKGMAEAKKARAEPRDVRIALEKRRVEIKAPALERCRLIDSEAARLKLRLVALEEPIDIQIKAEESRVQRLELERLEALRLRDEKIKERIQAMRDLPASTAGKPAIIIATKLGELEKTELLEEDFGEHYQTALDARDATIGRLTAMHAAQRQHEAEQAQIKADRERLEQLEREAEERRIADEQKAAAERAEADRLAREQREIEAARVQRIRDQIAELSFVAPIANWDSGRIDTYIAERNKLDPSDADNDFDFAEWQGEACDAFDKAIGHLHEIRRAAVQREREEYEASERRAEEERRLQAERDRQAEAQRKLDAQAEQLRKEKAAAAKKAEAERLANLGLREAAQAVVNYFQSDEFREISDRTGYLVPKCVFDLDAVLDNDAAQAKPIRAKKAARA